MKPDKTVLISEQISRQEPIGEVRDNPDDNGNRNYWGELFDNNLPVGTPLYTTPQPCPVCPGKDQLIGEQNRLNKERQEWALKNAETIRELKAKCAELESARPICPDCAKKIDEAAGVDVAALNRRIAELQEEFTSFHNIAHDRFAMQEERMKEHVSKIELLTKERDFQATAHNRAQEALLEQGAELAALAETVQKMRNLLPATRPEFGAVGSRDVDVRKQQQVFDEALALPDQSASVINRIKAAGMMEAVEAMSSAALDAIADAIGGDAYDCTRVWSAWGVGTMWSDDFVPIIEQSERLSEISVAVLNVFRARAAELEGK